MVASVRSARGEPNVLSTSVTINKSDLTGITTGDILYGLVSSDDAVYTSVTSCTFEAIDTGSGTSGAGDIKWALIGRKVDGTEPSTFVANLASSCDSAFGLICVSGADTSGTAANAIDTTSHAVAKTAMSGSDSSIVAPTCSPLSASALLLCFAVLRTQASGQTVTPPSGMTEQFDTNADWSSCAAASQELSSSGATGTKTFALAGGNLFWMALSFPVKSGAAGGAFVRSTIVVPTFSVQRAGSW